MDLAILSTEYGLMIYIFSNPNWKNTHYVFYGRLGTSHIRSMEEAGANHFLCHTGWGDCMQQLNAQNIPALKRQYLRLKKEWLRIQYQIAVTAFCKRHGKTLRTFAQMNSSISRILRPYHFNVIEDGIVNYEKSDRVIGGEMVTFCMENFVEHVYLSGRLPVPKEICNKTVIVDIAEQWENYNDSERNTILKLFHFNYASLLKLLQTGRNKILLTQPFYVYDECTIEEQISIYKDILSAHNPKEIIIKPHPGDTIPYETIFPDCVILREKFPFELCYFTHLPIQKIIAVNSTSLYGLWDETIIEQHKEMLQRMKSFRR